MKSIVCPGQVYPSTDFFAELFEFLSDKEEKRQLVQGTITERERLSTVDLLIKVTDFVKKR